MPTLLDKPPVTAAEKTYLQLRRAIVEGQIPPAAKLSEADLAETYDVSRAVIREAVGRLEGIRLVERTANVGARVVALSLEALAELYQVREALEGMAARLAALTMDEREVEDLHRLLVHHRHSIKDSETYYQEDGDVDFHYRILQGSKNKHLIALLMGSIYHATRMYRVQLGMAGPRIARAFDEHHHIVDAIAHRDAELAEMLMRRHIQHTRQEIESKLLAQSTASKAKLA